MGEIIITIVRWTLRLGIILSVVFSFTVLWALVLSSIAVVANQSVLADVFSLVQIWLPFNLSVILTWIVTAPVLYIAYRLSMFAAGLFNKFVGSS